MTLSEVERSRRYRQKLSERGWQRVEIKLGETTLKAIRRDPEYLRKGIAGLVVDVVEAYYGKGKP